MDLTRARPHPLDDSGIGVTPAELPPLSDSILSDPESGRVDPRRWFPNPDHPFEIEIGSGKGTFLIEHAARTPETNFLGFEWAREFYLYTADRLRRRLGGGLNNVRMLHADATEFIRWRCPAAIVRAIHLYYSDPWPKKRHHKNRVIQDSFLTEAARVLLHGGEIRIVTDHDDLWAWDLEHFARWAHTFDQLPFTPSEWVGAGELVGTNYERKTRADGREAHACILRRN